MLSTQFTNILLKRFCYISSDKAKDLIAKMRPKEVLKICDRYEQSGAGGGQRHLGDEEYGKFDF